MLAWPARLVHVHSSAVLNDFSLMVCAPSPQVYPTGVRSFFHGLSAAVGKVGALAAALAFTNVSAE